MATPSDQPDLSVWEKLDMFSGLLSVLSTVLYTSVTGVFRGKRGAKMYSMHVFHAAVRKMVSRLSARQAQFITPPTSKAYEEFMKDNRLPAETVTLPHGAVGHWFGKKDAKNVLVYYHGGGFALSASAGHFKFLHELLSALNSNGHDIALFFLAYTLAPTASHPTQLRQSTEALWHILASRAPAQVMIGGDSAGGNLALATLLHLSHPHPEIEPLPLSENLAGVFAFAPWVSFRGDWPSLESNRHKDLICKEALAKWSAAYLGGRSGDAWSEPLLAPTEWWRGAKADRVLVLAGRDEILLSAVEEFVERFKTVVPNTTFVVGYDETHVQPVYSGMLDKETQQGRALKGWVAARL